MKNAWQVLALVCLAASAPASVLWEGDTSRGSATFEGVELQPGRFGITSSPYGNCFYCETYDGHPDYPTGKQRCEVKGCKRPDGTNFRMAENNEYYVGWRSMWNPMPTQNGAWTAFMQLKGGGACHLNPPVGPGCALVIRTLGDGKLHMHLTCDGSYVVWSTNMPSNGTWSSFVTRWRLARSTSSGWVEFWYNGVQQTFNGPRGSGTTRQPAALWECEYQRLKYGVYRSGALNGSGTGRAHLWRPRVGTTYADVAPTGGGGTPTPTPAATATPVPTSTPGPTPTPCGSCTFSGYYRLMARHSGKAVVVQSASTAENANVFQWTYGGAATNDEWELVGIGSGYYRIVNRNSGKDMVVVGASTANGADVVQATYGGSSTNDEWQPVDLGTGYYRIVNRHSGKVLNVAGAGTTDGANVDQWAWANATQEQFQIVAVP
jgi:hypothetical protein